MPTFPSTDTFPSTLTFPSGFKPRYVREAPPLRQHIDVETPNGRHYRWGMDEPNPANVPSGLRYSDTMPGGFETEECVLPRKPGVDYSDLEGMSTVTVRGASGEVAWEGRLERTPRTSGDQIAISPSAVGWQANLEDDKSAVMPYVDRDLGHWSDPSVQRRLDTLTALIDIQGHAADHDRATGSPAIRTSFGVPVARNTVSEAFYLSPADLDQFYYAPVGYDLALADYGTDTNWRWGVFVGPDDRLNPAFDQPAGVSNTSVPAAGYVSLSGQRVLMIRHQRANAFGTGSEGREYGLLWTTPAVYGSHGLTRRGADPGGLYASDIVTHAVQSWAPMLNVTSESVQQSGFVIPHMAFLDRTTAGEIVRQATRFGLQDWAVWEDRTFWWHNRGARGRRWRARIAPAQLEETGPQVDRLWESVIVQYQDVDGSSRTVGPPGSGVDVEDAALKDPDPENPANKLGIVRRDLLQMGVSTAAGATEIGRRFLEEQKLLDSSGRATLVGSVEDDRGVLHPYWKVRAGDSISFVDASDSSYRRIVKSDKDYAARTCSIDIDAPPEGLAALLERLGVVLIPLGIN